MADRVAPRIGRSRELVHAAVPRGRVELARDRPEFVKVPRHMAAALRFRARWLLRFVPPLTARAVRFLPALLQTSFNFPGLRDEAPGVEGLGIAHRWPALAAALGLPPPVATKRGRRVVAAIVVAPRADGLDARVIPSPDAGAEELRRLAERVARIAKLLERHLSLSVLDPAADPEPVAHLVAFGALIAGRLPESFWPIGDGASPLGANALGRLAIHAPTPLLALALAVASTGGAPHPATRLFDAAVARLPARALADPELFCALWAGSAAGREAAFLEAVELASPGQAVRRFASLLREPGMPSPPPRGLTLAARAIALGRSLAFDALRAASRAQPSIRPALLRRLHREAIEPGVPAFLLPAVARGLAGSGGLPPPVRLEDGRAHAVLDGAGGVLARGRSAEQARLRAFALEVRCGRTAAAGGPVEPAWRRLAELFARPIERRTLVFVIEPAELPGAPADPLNRGPGRRLGFGTSLQLAARPGFRPSARRVPPDELVERLIREARAGNLVETLPASGAARPAAARLGRLAEQAARAPGPEVPEAVEVAGRVLVFGKRLRRFDARHFAARPVRCHPDPGAPDLGVGGRSVFGGAGSAGRLECLVTRPAPDRAALLYVDGSCVLREEVPLPWLETHLRETQTLLRDGPRPVALSVRVAPELEGLAGRLQPPATVEVEVEVAGSLPFGLGVTLHGEPFGADAPLGWRAAALTALSAWPPGAVGRLRVKAVTVVAGGLPASGLQRLYARSLAVRRLERHMRAQAGLKGFAGRVEREAEAEARRPPSQETPPMTMSIRTNVSSLNAQRNLYTTQNQLDSSLSKLSSGYRITKAGDDAAGLGISVNLEAQIKSYSQAARNAQDGISLVQTAEGSLNEISNILTRLRELTMQSASSGVSNTERGYISKEVTELTGEITRISSAAEFNGVSLLNSTDTLTFQVGIRGEAANDTITFDLTTADATLETLGLDALDLVGATEAESITAAEDALGTIDTALETISGARAALGAVGNRLNNAINNIQSAAENLSAANSRIRDVDVAEETSRMTRSQILMQAGVSVLAQANQIPQAALKLLG